MSEFNLSDYFINNNETNITHEIFVNVINTKQLRSFQNIEDPNRSICQMIRDINYYQNHNNEEICCKLIYYINNCVVTLQKYKDDWIKWLEKDSTQNIYKGRSLFNNNKKNQAINMLNIEHNIFKLFNDLYKVTTDDNIKNLILECTYYTYRINEKLLYYEQNNA